MQNTLVMHVLKSEDHTGDHELGLRLSEPPPLPDVISQVTAGQKVTAEIQVLPILESEVNVHKKWMLQLAEKLLLTHD